MRELNQNDIQQVSGAGVVTDWINNTLDAPARQLGSYLGEAASHLATGVFNKVTNVVSQVYQGVSSLISGFFKH